MSGRDTIYGDAIYWGGLMSERGAVGGRAQCQGECHTWVRALQPLELHSVHFCGSTPSFPPHSCLLRTCRPTPACSTASRIGVAGWSMLSHPLIQVFWLVCASLSPVLCVMHEHRHLWLSPNPWYSSPNAPPCAQVSIAVRMKRSPPWQPAYHNCYITPCAPHALPMRCHVQLFPQQ